MGRNNQTAMTRPEFFVYVCDIYSSPYPLLINNANQCTYLAKSLDFKRLQCMGQTCYGFSGIDYPKTKQELVQYAAQNIYSSQEELLDLIRSLPNRTYRNAADVAKALGEIKQTRAKTASA